MFVKLDQRKLTYMGVPGEARKSSLKPFFIKLPTESSEFFGLKLFIATNFHSSRANIPSN